MELVTLNALSVVHNMNIGLWKILLQLHLNHTQLSSVSGFTISIGQYSLIVVSVIGGNRQDTLIKGGTI